MVKGFFIWGLAQLKYVCLTVIQQHQQACETKYGAGILSQKIKTKKYFFHLQLFNLYIHHPVRKEVFTK
jgi:hypothetical protein